MPILAAAGSTKAKMLQQRLSVVGIEISKSRVTLFLSVASYSKRALLPHSTLHQLQARTQQELSTRISCSICNSQTTITLILASLLEPVVVYVTEKLTFH